MLNLNLRKLILPLALAGILSTGNVGASGAQVLSMHDARGSATTTITIPPALATSDTDLDTDLPALIAYQKRQVLPNLVGVVYMTAALLQSMGPMVFDDSDRKTAALVAAGIGGAFFLASAGTKIRAALSQVGPLPEAVRPHHYQNIGIYALFVLTHMVNTVGQISLGACLTTAASHDNIVAQVTARDDCFNQWNPMVIAPVIIGGILMIVNMGHIGMVDVDVKKKRQDALSLIDLAAAPID